MSTTFPNVTRTVRPDYASVSDVAVLMGVGRSTVRRWVYSGRLEARRSPGGGLLIPLEALRRLPSVHEEMPRRAHRHRH